MTNATSSRQAGAAQGWMTVLINQLPMMAIVALMPALPTLMAHSFITKMSGGLLPAFVTTGVICLVATVILVGYNWVKKA